MKRRLSICPGYLTRALAPAKTHLVSYPHSTACSSPLRSPSSNFLSSTLTIVTVHLLSSMMGKSEQSSWFSEPASGSGSPSGSWCRPRSPRPSSFTTAPIWRTLCSPPATRRSGHSRPTEITATDEEYQAYLQLLLERSLRDRSLAPPSLPLHRIKEPSAPDCREEGAFLGSREGAWVPTALLSELNSVDPSVGYP